MIEPKANGTSSTVEDILTPSSLTAYVESA